MIKLPATIGAIKSPRLPFAANCAACGGTPPPTLPPPPSAASNPKEEAKGAPPPPSASNCPQLAPFADASLSRRMQANEKAAATAVPSGSNAAFFAAAAEVASAVDCGSSADDDERGEEAVGEEGRAPTAAAADSSPRSRAIAAIADEEAANKAELTSPSITGNGLWLCCCCEEVVAGDSRGAKSEALRPFGNAGSSANGPLPPPTDAAATSGSACLSLSSAARSAAEASSA